MFILPRKQTSSAAADGPHDDDSYGSRILAACWLVNILSTIIIGLRVYCKLKRSKALWYDDHILIASWLFQSANIILITINVTLGDGQHTYNLSDPAVLPLLGLTGNISGTLSIAAACLSKTSFGVTLLRLCNAATHRAMRWSIWVLLVSMNISLALSAVFIWAQCSPSAKNWYDRIPGTCWDPAAVAKYGLFSGIYSAFADFVLSFLPWPLIWGLQMQMREKIGVAVAMSMGVFAGLGAIAKALQLHNLSSGDFTYHESKIVIWGTVETAVTIMAASVPFLRILIVEATSSPAPPCPARVRFPKSDEQELVLEDEEKAGVVDRPASS
ncbi:hypothetical protein QBC47DRAFT_396371 [Echria macrotheca]|uniref:Rhodopsin domain-containing protein n=1 Tax=Echria macrotheca TaxID=438768 RepID=A0AAJ0BLW7_9PEZI|nr:hypothetical protein QBC47DRAFT_396371 [Echria macrotheca]